MVELLEAQEQMVVEAVAVIFLIVTVMVVPEEMEL
jgi:hypothetical protein